MARFSFRVDNVLFTMDSTSQVRTTYRGKLSKSPMQDQQTQADNYIIQPPVCTMKGRITDIKTPTSPDTRPTGTWIDDVLNKAIRGAAPVFLKNYVDKEPTSGWFITSFAPTQTSELGVGFQGANGKVIQAFEIDLTFEQAILARGLTTATAPSDRYVDAVDPLSATASSTSEFESGSEKDSIAKRNTLSSLKSAGVPIPDFSSFFGGGSEE